MDIIDGENIFIYREKSGLVLQPLKFIDWKRSNIQWSACYMKVSLYILDLWNVIILLESVWIKIYVFNKLMNSSLHFDMNNIYIIEDFYFYLLFQFPAQF